MNTRARSFELVVLAFCLGLLTAILIMRRTDRRTEHPSVIQASTLIAPTPAFQTGLDNGTGDGIGLLGSLPDELEEPETLAPFLGSHQKARETVALEFADRGDASVVWPLLVAENFAQLGAVPPLSETEWNVIERLAGPPPKAEGIRDWKVWEEGLLRDGAYHTHPGFATFQSILLSMIDGQYARLLRAGAAAEFPREQIVWRGTSPNGLFSLHGPAVVAADSPEAGVYRDDEEVIGVALDGRARAYPVRILEWHEIVNDNLGERRLCVFFCNLSGTVAAYDSVIDGRTRLTFANAGLARAGVMVAYDEQSRSLWTALDGRPLLGRYQRADPRPRLQALPAVHTTWGEWRRMRPDTDILSPATGFNREYNPDVEYGEMYGWTPGSLPIVPAGGPFEDFDWIVGLNDETAAKAFPLSALEGGGALAGDWRGEPVLIVGDAARREARVYRTDGRALIRSAGESRLRDATTGAEWELTEEALLGPDGLRFERIPSKIAHWHAWRALYEETEVAAANPLNERNLAGVGTPARSPR